MSAGTEAQRPAMTQAEAAEEIAWLDSRGPAFRACEGPAGWYEATWFEPTVGRPWRKACNVGFGYDRALARLIQDKVEGARQ